MKSKWSHLKEIALEMRRNGTSMSAIERVHGIPRSTQSLWFKDITQTNTQRDKLAQNSTDGWAKARVNAVKWHNSQKAARLSQAKQTAQITLDKICISPEILDLAFAMLYLGEGAKSGKTAIANSNPKVLRFVLAVLTQNYAITPDKIRCDLHLRADQDPQALKSYWAAELQLPLSCFKYVAVDKRSIGKPTYDHYKGVCIITCGRIDIQRKIMYLYSLFCDKVSEPNAGA